MIESMDWTNLTERLSFLFTSLVLAMPRGGNELNSQNATLTRRS